MLLIKIRTWHNLAAASGLIYNQQLKNLQATAAKSSSISSKQQQRQQKAAASAESSRKHTPSPPHTTQETPTPRTRRNENNQDEFGNSLPLRGIGKGANQKSRQQLEPISTLENQPHCDAPPSWWRNGESRALKNYSGLGLVAGRTDSTHQGV